MTTSQPKTKKKSKFDLGELIGQLLIEQIILNESMDAFPDILPEKFHNYEGYSEVRLRSIFDKDFYIKRFFELLEKMYSIGWEDMYLKNQYKMKDLNFK